ncbi:MAG: hypothetical protein AB1679_33720 [Actinomycetota bacterium]
MTGVSQFRLALPVGWIELDLNPATRSEAIVRIMAERGGAAAGAGVSSAEMARLLEELASQAEAKQGVYAAFYSDVLEGRPVAASLIVSMVQAGGGPPPPGADSLAVAQALRARFPPGHDVELRQLAAGPAVRARRRLEAPLGGTIVALDNVQYLVPRPDLTQLAILDFSTPTVGLADAFAEVFDAIAGTLGWT